jgi:hypothetical protein
MLASGYLPFWTTLDLERLRLSRFGANATSAWPAPYPDGVTLKK